MEIIISKADKSNPAVGFGDPLRPELDSSGIYADSDDRYEYNKPTTTRSIKPIEIDNLRREVTYLKLRLSSYEMQEKLKEKTIDKKQSLPQQVFIYIATLGAFFTIFAFLAYVYDKDQVQITVNYEIGQIIGGVTVGVAALVAAHSYSKKEESSATSVNLDTPNQVE